MYESNAFFTNPCYHEQPGMTYPHNQDLCDHVPDMAGTPYGNEYQYVPAYYPTTNISVNEHCCYPSHDHHYHVQSFDSGYSTKTYSCEGTPALGLISPQRYTFADEDHDSVKRIYEEISAECEHLLLKKNCHECRLKPVDSTKSQHIVPPGSQNNSINSNNISSTHGISPSLNAEVSVVDEETTQLALSMMRKREQNKVAAARYREKKKNKCQIAKDELQQLELKNRELQKIADDLQKEVNKYRQKLGLPLAQ